MAVIKDVAKLAGVSTGTVSKYLNNPHELREATRLRVKQAIEELRYKPSPLARSMRTGRTNTLAVIVPDVTNPFFAEVYNSIRSSAMQKGYSSILYTTEDNLNTLKDYLASLSLRHVDGIILCFLDEDEAVEKFIEELQSYIPIVLLSWDMNNTNVNSIVVDVFEGIYSSTKHLINLGYKNIAYIGGPVNSRISMEKFNGYSKALKEADMELNPHCVYHGSYSLQCGYQAARMFLMQSTPPGAIVGANDIIALGSLKYLLHKKINVPDDIAVTGFDNISLSAMYEPALSTVALPIGQMGKEAIRLVLSEFDESKQKKRQIILDTRLIVRKSTDRTAPVELDMQ